MIEYLDEGPEGWESTRYDLTAVQFVLVPVDELDRLPSGNRERELLRSNGRGRMMPREWRQFVADIRKRGIQERLMVIVEKDGSAALQEGNHRLHAAKEIGLYQVPVEVRYFGNVQRQGWLYPEEDR
jgi:hypothetical protein